MSDAPVSPSPSGQLTVAGTTLGTPAYMSPEQCLGTTADHRSDIYSLGVIAYEALAGKRPFSGSFHELIRQHCEVKPERLDALGATSRRIADAVARSLEKSPDDRYQSARAFAGSLYAAAEAPSAIIRRAVSIVSQHPGLFLGISMRAFIPALPLIALTLLLLMLRNVVPSMTTLATYSMSGSVFAWAIVTVITNAAGAIAIEHLRTRPLDVLAIRELFGDVREHLGLARDAGVIRTMAKLAVFYVGAEFRARAGMGDLAFLIRFLERRPAGEVRERVDLLRRGVERSYDWVRGLLALTMILIPAVEGCVLFAVATLLSLKHAADIAVFGAALFIPINAIVTAPVFAIALSLVYYRARQAAGEDVPLAAVVMSAL